MAFQHRASERECARACARVRAPARACACWRSPERVRTRARVCARAPRTSSHLSLSPHLRSAHVCGRQGYHGEPASSPYYIETFIGSSNFRTPYTSPDILPRHILTSYFKDAPPPISTMPPLAPPISNVERECINFGVQFFGRCQLWIQGYGV